MSSFIVAPLTINRIVSWILDNSGEATNIEVYRRFIKGKVNRLLKANHIKLQNGEDLNSLSNAFLYMNKLATDYRYGENHVLEKHKFEYMKVSDIQALKSMECLRYQASEGDIPKSKLYKILNKLIDICMYKISHNGEYEKAEWG